jgi:hypothetical protein
MQFMRTKKKIMKQMLTSPLIFIAFFVSVPKLDRIADAEEQIKVGSDYLNKGSLDMVSNCNP